MGVKTASFGPSKMVDEKKRVGDNLKKPKRVWAGGVS